MMRRRRRVFLLSPASGTGRRAQLLLDTNSSFELAVRLRSSDGVMLGDAFCFMSGLYFRGKLAYARAYASPPAGWPGAQIIAPGEGLLSADTRITLADLRRIARVRGDLDEPMYVRPVLRDAKCLAESLAEGDQAILLGSVATDKYRKPLLEALGSKLQLPSDFVGRGGLSRGSLLLRAVESGEELSYLAAADAPRRGKRPPPFAPRSSDSA